MNYAKFFIFVAVLLYNNVSFAKKIIIRKEGSADGIHYDRVRETHTNPWIGEDSHRLICLNAGNTKCDWQHAPWIVGNTHTWDYYQFIDIVEQRIKDYFDNNENETYYERINIDGIEVVISATRRNNGLFDYEATIIDKE